MTKRQIVPANTDRAEIFPYSRAVKVGNIIEVCGTGSFDKEGNFIGRDDVTVQSKPIYSIIRDTLAELGGELTDVVKLRGFVTDIGRWEEVARAHRQFFPELAPAAAASNTAGCSKRTSSISRG